MRVAWYLGNRKEIFVKSAAVYRGGCEAVLYDAIAWSVLLYAAGHQARSTWRVNWCAD